MFKLGKNQQKILLVLMSGVTLGFAGSPRHYLKILRQAQKEWRKIDQQSFKRSANVLIERKLIEEKIFSDGSCKLVLTAEGKRQAQKTKILNDSLDFKKPKHWDGKWRVVAFDVPEDNRVFRDILRKHLRTLKFYKIQHSVFVSPHPFEKIISDLAALYNAKAYVRVVTVIKLDNEGELKKHFAKSI